MVEICAAVVVVLAFLKMTSLSC